MKDEGGEGKIKSRFKLRSGQWKQMVIGLSKGWAGIRTGS